MSKLLTPENVLNLLLIFVPIAIVLELMHAGPTLIFVTSCLAIIPLAGVMGKATEHLAERVGEGIGGLLNATFGNAAELIIAIVALRAGLYDVVKASITGSIIGNILLVFGLSAVLGGAKYSTQKFNKTAASMGTTMLTIPLRRVGLISFLATLLIVPINAQTRTQIDISRLGPQVGERVPDFTLADQSGRQRTLQSIMGSRGAMLVFVRSADW